MSDAFNDDLSADMNDPEFAAEFDRTTDEVRRERYATPLFALMRDIGWDGERTDQVDREMFAIVDAVMAVANEEIQAAKMKATQIVTCRWFEESVRTNRLIQDLRSDLQESADALEESAQLLEDALNESERLRAELDQLKRAAKIVTENRWYERLGRAEDTISRVRALADDFDRQGKIGIAIIIRKALDGESE